MPNVQMTVIIEVPRDVPQQEVWELEEQFKQVEGIDTNLMEARDLLAATELVLSITVSVMGSVAAVGGGIKTVQEAAKIIYEFIHRNEKPKSSVSGKKKVVIRKKGKQIELYDISLEELERILRD